MTNYYRHIVSGNLWKEIPKTYPFTTDIGFLLELIGPSKKQAFFKNLNDFQPIKNSEDVHSYFLGLEEYASFLSEQKVNEANNKILKLQEENKKLKEIEKNFFENKKAIYQLHVDNKKYLSTLEAIKNHIMLNLLGKVDAQRILSMINKVIFDKVFPEQPQDIALTQDFVVDSYVEDGIEMSADKARKITNTKSNIEGLWKDIDEQIEINAMFGLNEVDTLLAIKYGHNTILRYRNRGFVVKYSKNQLTISW